MPNNERVRVYDLARELGLANKELLSLLEREGVPAKSHSSSLESDVANLIRDIVVAERQKQNAKATAASKAIAEQKKAAEAPAPAAAKPSDAKPNAPKPATAKPTAAQPEQKKPEAPKPQEVVAPAKEEEPKELKEIHLKTPITVRELAEALERKPNEVIMRLMTMNVFPSINQPVDEELVSKVCEFYGVKFVRVRRDKLAAAAPVQEKAQQTSAQKSSNLVPRPPVVVFMGHVDHGKTSIQDYIRKTHVAQGESGGITQHIGASVATVGKQTITFLDTPGHEAFTAMRARGANATDIAVLVVAADDGVMPQTIEAINHARAAKIPIIVAMNKMDLPGANPDKVYLGLQQNGINPEDWGGTEAVIPVSAKTGQGISDLLERILLEAEMLELKADPTADFEGLVIEAQMEQGMGPTASVLVQNGTLRIGDVLICGQCYGKVKALIDSQGRRVAKALPATPIKIMGLSGVPEAGDKITLCANEREAKEIADEAARQARLESNSVEAVTLESLFENLKKEDKPDLKLILKTDVRGSLEAIVDSIAKIKSEKVTVTVIHSGVGEITENDVILATASKAIIMGFHVRSMPGVNKVAKQKGVEIRLYSIIYELLEDVENAMRGQLTPEFNEKYLGRAEIVQIFTNSKVGKICGCRVNDGLIRVNAKAKVYRDKELIYNGLIHSLKHFKDDVREVKSGLECGITLDNFEDFEEHDIIEVFESIKIVPQL
ncbi:MAG: translation initiation factor IF-2 [Victivallales bacterium]|nr:translation initiation factor IF-2 [Victivallales bacterium]